MLVRVEFEHLPELKKIALSCNDSLLHDVPNDVGWIAKKLVKNGGLSMVYRTVCRR
jgi:hypothetical protein